MPLNYTAPLPDTAQPSNPSQCVSHRKSPPALWMTLDPEKFLPSSWDMYGWHIQDLGLSEISTLKNLLIKSSSNTYFQDYPGLCHHWQLLHPHYHNVSLLLVNDNLTFFQLTCVSTLLFSRSWDATVYWVLLFLLSVNPLLFLLPSFFSLFFTLNVIKLTLFGVQFGVQWVLISA